MGAIPKSHLSFRVHPDDLARITQLAAEHHMSRSQYIVCMTTGQMPSQRSEAMERIEALEQRVGQVERAVDLGSAY